MNGELGLNDSLQASRERVDEVDITTLRYNLGLSSGLHWDVYFKTLLSASRSRSCAYGGLRQYIGI